jgi:DNA-binding NarL/FixJ family response regulator
MTKNYSITDFGSNQSSKMPLAGTPAHVAEEYPAVAMVQFTDEALLETKDPFGTAPCASSLSRTRSGPDPWSSEPIASRLAIVLIEPRTLIRDCLTKGLQSSGSEIVEAFASASDWVKAHSHDSAAPLVLLSTAGGDSAHVEREIAILSGAEPLASIVLLSDDAGSDRVLGALDKGARGYISTSMSFDVAMKAIQLVRAGGTFIPVECLRTPKPSADAGAIRTNLPARGTFTARQLAVIESLRQGKANKIIAFELNMRESTVKVHVRNIMKKLQAKNRTEVAFRINEMASIDKTGPHPSSSIFTKYLP